MELRYLETFAAVARYRSFTRAAEILNLTQPAVTRQIAVLEAELKTLLLDRMGRRVELTAAGRVLQNYANDMIRLEREARRAVSDVASGMAGTVAVGASSTLATYLLPPVLRRFREAHPGVEVSIHTGPSAQVAAMVASNEADLGVVTQVGAPSDLLETVLGDYATGVVVYPGHPLAVVEALNRTVTASDLAGNPLILMDHGSNLRTYVDRLLSAAGVEEQVTMELDNVEAIKKMIEARLGISLLPLLAVQPEVESGRLVALPLADVPGARRRIAAIHRKDKYVTSAMQALLTLLKSAMPVA